MKNTQETKQKQTLQKYLENNSESKPLSPLPPRPKTRKPHKGAAEEL